LGNKITAKRAKKKNIPPIRTTRRCTRSGSLARSNPAMRMMAAATHAEREKVNRMETDKNIIITNEQQYLLRSREENHERIFLLVVGAR